MTNTPDFLTRIIEQKRVRLERVLSEPARAEEVRDAALRVRGEARPHALRAALASETGFHIIAEIKRASPSLGDIRRDLAPAEVARLYETAGAVAISVLTEE